MPSSSEAEESEGLEDSPLLNHPMRSAESLSPRDFTLSSSEDDGESGSRHSRHYEHEARNQSRRPRGRPEKRQFDEDPLQSLASPSKRSKRSRRDSSYRNTYRELFNETLQHAVSEIDYFLGNHDPLHSRPLRSSQLGMTEWRPAEKRTFFTILGRHGINNTLHKLPQILPGKSAAEIHQYLRLLQRGSNELHLEGNTREVVHYADIPASHEVSERCCRALEDAADSLGQRQEKYEVKREKIKWGDWWLLDQTAAMLLEEDGRNQQPALEGHEQELTNEAVPNQLEGSMTLLNLPIWLELSERVFMNTASSSQSKNWFTTPSFYTAMPAIFTTAFVDFHNVAISITKRLISAVIFEVESRVRATDRHSKPIKPTVNTNDVRAAVDMLGMKRDTLQYWTGVPRRCGLKVYDTSEKISRVKLTHRAKLRGSKLSMAEVESRLNPLNLLKDGQSGSETDSVGPESASRDTSIDPSEASLTDSSPSQLTSNEEGNSSDSEHGRIERSSTSSSVIDPADIPYIPETNEADALAASQVVYANGVDGVASRREENYLWDILDMTPPRRQVFSSMQSDIEAESLERTEPSTHGRDEETRSEEFGTNRKVRRPDLRRKRPTDLSDKNWRRWLGENYIPDWERPDG